MNLVKKIKAFFQSLKPVEKFGCKRAKCLCTENGITNKEFIKTCSHYGKIN